MGEPSNTKGNRKSTATYFDTNNSTFDNTNAWDDLHAFVPEPSPEVGIEEVEADEVCFQLNTDTKNRRFVDPYPLPVGVPIGHGKTTFQVLYEKHKGQDESIYAPFTNEEEWELTKWLSQRIGQKVADKYLKLSIVSPEIEFNTS